MRGREGNETEWDRETDRRIKRERGIVMGAREKERRPRRENCSESPTRILGQTEETRSRRCNGLSLSLILAPIDRSVSIPHGETESGHTIVFPIFLLSNVYRRLSRSREGGILDYANDGRLVNDWREADSKKMSV